AQPPGTSSTITTLGIGGDAIVREPRMEISMPGRIDLTKGESYSLTVNITNPVKKTNLTNIVLQTSGYPETLIKKTPYMITNIAPDQTKSFALEISVPPYIEGKDYIVTVTATGTGTGLGSFSETKSIESSGKIVFAVHGVVENESLWVIKDAELALEEMEESDFAFLMLNGYLENAKKAYSELDFDKAKELAQNVVELKEKAFRIFSLSGQLEKDIEDARKYGIWAEEAEEMLDLVKSAFQRGDYKRAEERITAAVTAYQLETKNILPLLKFLYEYWSLISLSIILIVISSLFMKKRLKIRSLEKNMKESKNKEIAVKGLIKNLQDEYFKKHRISKLDYDMRKQNYEKRLAKISSQELRLATKIILMKGRNERESLLKGKNSIEERLKGAQHNYFELGKIGKDEYEEVVKELQKELAEIERQLKKIEKPKQSKAMLGFLVLLVFLVVFPSISGALDATREDVTAAIKEAEKVTEEMKNLGFGTGYANHTIEEAELLLSRGEYDSALTMARYVSVIKEKAMVVYEMIDDVEMKVYDLSSQGHNVSESRKLFSEGAGEFEKENYEGAEELLNQAMNLLDKIEAEAALSRAAGDNLLTVLIERIYENRMAVSFAVILLVLVSIPLLVKIRRMKKARGIRNLEREVESIKKSMKHLQEDYFRKRSLSKKDYDTRMEKYRHKLGLDMEKLIIEKSRKTAPAPQNGK
ncbi:MAG: hypothetical protein V3U72_04995, partial [Candidatus Aenigmarchaeota archaeon]